MEKQRKTPEPSIQYQLIQFSNKHLPKYLIRYLSYPIVLKILSKLLCIEELFELKDKFKDKSNFELVDAIINYAGLSCKCENINKIPLQGRLIIVANHPLGGADWLLIMQCLSAVRKDIKVVINKDVHTLIINLRDLFIPVDTYASFNDLARKQIGECLEREEAVIIFPSGGISILTIKGVRDRKWKNGVAFFSREYQTDILPIFIGGRFNLPFYFYPIRLRRFLLIRNLLHPTSQNVKVVIGDKVSHEELLKEKDLSNISSHLKTVAYQLGKQTEHNS
jgi:putative hemolysin